MIIERPKPENEEENFTGDSPKEYKKSYRKEKLERVPQHKQPIEERDIDDAPMASAVADIDRIPMDERPTVKVVREDGSNQRRRRAVGLGLSDLILPPFTKATVARYRMINRGRIDPSTGKEPVANDALFPGTYTFYDKFESDPVRRNKLMKNLGREEVIFNNETQKEERRYTINDIEFVNGVKEVNVEKNYREYVFMELHPLNGSNKYRTTDSAPEFERVDLKTNISPALQAALLDLAMDAEIAVRDEIKDQQLIIGYAVQFGITVDGRQPGEIKQDLRIAARNDPRKFFASFKDIGPAIKLNIHDGLGKGIITYEASKKRFEFTETGQVIHMVPLGADPIEDFVQAIKNEEDKMAMYEEMMEMLNYWV
jgi:hypothetical protein